MLSAVIIDDEKIICELIKRLGNWSGLGIEVVGEANDGVSALALLERLRPDIAIIDMRIPGMDGITVIERCQEKGIPTRFLVISGYKEFEYARQALSLNVANYLVKPINQDELNDSLRKICDDKAASMHHQERFDVLKKRVSLQKEHIYDKLLHDIENGVFSADDTNLLNETYGLYLPYDAYTSFIVKLDIQCPDRAQNKIVSDYLDRMIGETLGSSCEFGCVRRSGRLIYMVNHPHHLHVSSLLETVVTRAVNYVQTYESYSVTFGFGRPKNTISGISCSYFEAVSAVEYRRCLGQNRMIIYDGEITQTRFFAALPTDSADMIKDAISSQDFSPIRAMIEENYEQCNGPLLHYYFPGFAIQMIQAFRDVLVANGEDKLTSDLDLLLSSIDNEIKAYHIKSSLEKVLGKIFDEYLESRLQYDNRHIRIAKDYIEKHYADAVTLEDISAAVHLNPVYFSALFKSKTGMTVTDYLQSVRIRSAQTLFSTTDMTVKEICAAVGYSDVKYFSKLFKKSVGVTPSLYRKLYSAR